MGREGGAQQASQRYDHHQAAEALAQAHIETENWKHKYYLKESEQAESISRIESLQSKVDSLVKFLEEERSLRKEA